MSMSLDDHGASSASNALYLARACDLAYMDEAVAAPRFQSELGLEARLISVDNTQVYIGVNDQAIVAAFRGSQAPTTLDGLKDWLLTNANNYLILPEGRKDQGAPAVEYRSQSGRCTRFDGCLAAPAEFRGRARDHHLRRADDRQRRGGESL
jgi:hypothetical protein